MAVAAESPLYERLAHDLGASIAKGQLRAGDRLPSVRRLARERSVSVATVLQAYFELENEFLGEVRPKSGHFVRRERGPELLEPSTPRRETAMGNDARVTDHPDERRIGPIWAAGGAARH